MMPDASSIPLLPLDYQTGILSWAPPLAWVDVRIVQACTFVRRGKLRLWLAPVNGVAIYEFDELSGSRCLGRRVFASLGPVHGG